MVCVAQRQSGAARCAAQPRLAQWVSEEEATESDLGSSNRCTATSGFLVSCITCCNLLVTHMQAASRGAADPRPDCFWPLPRCHRSSTHPFGQLLGAWAARHRCQRAAHSCAGIPRGAAANTGAALRAECCVPRHSDASRCAGGGCRCNNRRDQAGRQLGLGARVPAAGAGVARMIRAAGAALCSHCAIA